MSGENDKTKTQELSTDFEFGEIVKDEKGDPISLMTAEIRNTREFLENKVTQYLNILDKRVEKDREIELKRLEIEEKKVANDAKQITNDQKQQTFGNVLLLLAAITFIVLGVMGLLKIEFAVFLMALMVIGPVGLGSLKKHLS